MAPNSAATTADQRTDPLARATALPTNTGATATGSVASRAAKSHADIEPGGGRARDKAVMAIARSARSRVYVFRERRFGPLGLLRSCRTRASRCRRALEALLDRRSRR